MPTPTIDLISGRFFVFKDKFLSTAITGDTSLQYSRVNTYYELPDPTTSNDEIYVVVDSIGDYLVGRKESGLYYSNGIEWHRLGDIPSFFSSANFSLYDNDDNTKEISFTLSGITTNTTRNITIQDKDGELALLSDVDLKLDTSNFTGYTATTDQFLTKSSSGIICDDCLISNVGNDSIQFEDSKVAIWDNPNKAGRLKIFDISGTTLFIPTGTTQYVVINYNNGNPEYQILTDSQLINESNVLPVVTAYRLRTLVHYIDWDSLGNGLSNKLHERFVRTDRFKREYGLELSVSGDTKLFHISSGRLWIGAVKKDLDQFNSNVDISSFLFHINGEWDFITGSTQFNNTHYDDGNNLVEISNNKFGVNWVYRLQGNSAIGVYVLGNQEYDKISTAQASQPPLNLPVIINSHAILVGRIIIQKDIPTPILVESAFTRQFIGSQITDHGTMDGLLDDDHPQYTLLSGRPGQTLNVDNLNVNTGTTKLNIVNFTGGIKYKVTTVSGSSYTVNNADIIIGVDSTILTEVEIILPLVSSLTNHIFIIKDQGFNCATNNIIIKISGDNLIEKTTQLVMATDGMSITIYNDGINNWYVI